MELVAKLDDLGKPAWIALMVLGFIIFWPVGLGLLAYMIWSGRMGCNGRGKRWGREWRREMSKFAGRYEGGHRGGRGMPSSGNHAFDEYREETLKRLEAEQKEFGDYLERLRMAKDKAEFEQFMNERRTRPTGPVTGSGTDGEGFEGGTPSHS